MNLRRAENLVQEVIVNWNCHALFPKVAFVNGAVQETICHKYPFFRIKYALYETDVRFVGSAYEAPTRFRRAWPTACSAALASATIAATGNKNRKMPFAEQLV